MADLLTQLWSVLAAPQPAPAGGAPLPMRRPEPAGLRPEDLVIPNPLSNFDPRTGAFLGGPASANQPAPPPLPVRRPESAAPPIPMRKPEPPAPPLPVRRPEIAAANAAPPPVQRPELPNVPGIMVDSAPPAGGDLISQLRRAFTSVPMATAMTPLRVFDGVGGPAQGTPQPSIPQPSSNIQTGSIGPWQTTVTPASTGPTITGKDVASFFRNLARGAASADPTAPGLTAFAQGMAGSMLGMHKEAQEAQKAQLEQGEREFERQMKTAEQRRAEAKERREARKAEIENAKAVTEIMRNLGGDLTTDQKFRFESAIRDYAKAINPTGLLTEEELKPRLEAYREELMRNIAGQPQTGAASAAGPRQPPTPGQVINGYRFKGGNPADRNSWERVN